MASTFLKLVGVTFTLFLQIGCQRKEHEIANRKSDAVDTFQFHVPDSKSSIEKNSALHPNGDLAASKINVERKKEEEESKTEGSTTPSISK